MTSSKTRAWLDQVRTDECVTIEVLLEEDATAVVKAVRENRGLKSLVLRESSVDFDLGVSLADAVSSNESVSTFGMVLCTGQGVRELLRIAASPHLTSFEVRGCDVCREGFRLLGLAARGNTQLRKIILGNDASIATAELSLMLLETRVSELVLNECAFAGMEEVQALGDLLERSESLVSLKMMCHHQICEKAASILSKALQKNPRLRRFDLQYKEIGHAVVAFASLLGENNHLHHLGLRGSCGDDGIGAIADSLLTNKVLTSLNLSQNLIIAPATVTRLLDAVRCNGMLLSMELPVSGDDELRLHGYTRRNREMHCRAKRAVVALIAAQQFRNSVLTRIPRHIIILVAQFLWATRSHFDWDVCDNVVTSKQRKIE